MSNNPVSTQQGKGVTIRRLEASDLYRVERLAQRDTRPLPAGWLLGAERQGRLIAAISVDTGEWVADPFHPTAEVVELLRLRAHQLAGPPPPPPRRSGLRRLLGRGPAHPAPATGPATRIGGGPR